MTAMTEQEWAGVQEALCAGGLRGYIDNLLTARSAPPIALNFANRRILEQAYDDGDGGTITLVPSDDPPWFLGTWEGHEVCQAVEVKGTLFTVVHASGGGLVSVIVGRDLIENEAGVTFRSVAEAKAYVLGLTHS